MKTEKSLYFLAECFDTEKAQIAQPSHFLCPSNC